MGQRSRLQKMKQRVELSVIRQQASSEGVHMAFGHEVWDLLFVSCHRSLPDCKEATAMVLVDSELYDELGEHTLFFVVRTLGVGLYPKTQYCSLDVSTRK